MTSVVITSRTRRIERSFARTEPSAPRRSGPHLHPRTGRSAVREAKVPAIVLPSDHQPGSRIGVLDGAARCCLMPITGSRPQAVLRRVQPRIAAVQPDACRDARVTVDPDHLPACRALLALEVVAGALQHHRGATLVTDFAPPGQGGATDLPRRGARCCPPRR